MAKQEDILEGARTIRPYLPELLGVKATSIDSELAGLLERATSGATVEKDILETLSRDEPARQWMETFLANRLGLLSDSSRDFFPLPGWPPNPLAMPRYECPRGDYVWYRPTIDTPVPACPTHGYTLQKA